MLTVNVLYLHILDVFNSLAGVYDWWAYGPIYWPFARKQNLDSQSNLIRLFPLAKYKQTKKQSKTKEKHLNRSIQMIAKLSLIILLCNVPFLYSSDLSLCLLLYCFSSAWNHTNNMPVWNIKSQKHLIHSPGQLWARILFFQCCQSLVLCVKKCIGFSHTWIICMLYML